jgi:two-component system chemotaxis sensor kinase CheA
VGKDGLVDELFAVCSHIERTTGDLRDEIMRSRMVPVANVFRRLPRLVRDVAQQSGKVVDLVVEGETTELDRSVVDGVADPLIHLLRNAVDHGIEPPEDRVHAGKPRRGTIRLAARHEEGHIAIDVTDDGGGIDPDRVRSAAVRRGLVTQEQADRMSTAEAVELIFVPGFSTASAVTEVSGRGVGMDIVRSRLEAINGSIAVETELGVGTHFVLRLPLTLAIIRALLVRVQNQTFALPLSSVVEVLRLPAEEVRRVNRRPVIDLRGAVLPLFQLAELLDIPEDPATVRLLRVVVARAVGRQVALVVDRLAGEQEVVIKSLGDLVGQVRGIVGATILGDGRLCPILDVGALVAVHAESLIAEEVNA